MRTPSTVLRRSPLVLALAASLAALAVAGCGGSSSSSSTSTPAPAATPAASTAPKADDAAIQKTIDDAFQAHVPAATLDPTIRDALTLAATPPSQATLDKAFACWTANQCDVGKGKITVGIADAFGDNTWRKFSKMSAILQALAYPEVGKIIYTNGHAKLSTYQANIRSLSAQGANVIVALNDFGASAYSAFAAAERAGAVVSSGVSPQTDAPTTAIAVRVEPDICKAGQAMAQVTQQAFGKNAAVAYFSGVPGNPQDQGWSACATKAGLNPVYKADTNFTPAGTFSAASGLISSGKPAKAILYSYSNPVPQIVKAYEKANKPVPAIVTWTQDNGTSCQWKKDQAGANAWKLYQTNALNWVSRVNVTAAIEKSEGKSPKPVINYPQPFIAAKLSDCHADLPADYPGTSALVPDSLVSKLVGS